MKAEGTIAHGGGGERSTKTAVTCPRMLEEPTCNRKTDGSGCEPKTFVVDDGDGGWMHRRQVETIETRYVTSHC